MAERRHTQEQRALAELRLRQGQPAAAVARELELSERSVSRWRDALGIAPKPRGFPRGKPRTITAATVEADFTHWVEQLGKQFSDTQTLAEAQGGLLTMVQRNWRRVTRGEEYAIGKRVTDPSAVLAVGGTIESEAGWALFSRVGGTDWDVIGAALLAERALPADTAHAEGQRLRGEVLNRLLILSEAHPVGSALNAACSIVASRLLGEDLTQWGYDGRQVGWAASGNIWQAARVRELRSRKSRQP